MKPLAVTALVLALAGPAHAQQQDFDTMDYIRSVQAQRESALNELAVAQARLTALRAQLAELKKKLDEKAPSDK